MARSEIKRDGKKRKRTSMQSKEINWWKNSNRIQTKKTILQSLFMTKKKRQGEQREIYIYIYFFFSKSKHMIAMCRCRSCWYVFFFLLKIKREIRKKAYSIKGNCVHSWMCMRVYAKNDFGFFSVVGFQLKWLFFYFGYYCTVFPFLFRMHVAIPRTFHLKHFIRLLCKCFCVWLSPVVCCCT